MTPLRRMKMKTTNRNIMKKFIVTLMVVSVGLIANAQRSKVEDALRMTKQNPPDYDRAVEYINEALEHPDSKSDSKTHRAVGDIFVAISADTNLTKKYPNAAYKGIEGYIKSMELNTSGYEYKTSEKYLFTENGITVAYNLGLAAYKKEEYAKAVEFFELMLRAIPLDRNEMLKKRASLTADYLHTIAAQAAHAGGMHEKAIYHYTKVMEMSPTDQNPYIAISQINLEKGDTTAAFAIVKKGRDIMPDSLTLREHEINLYLVSGRIGELESKVDEALKKEPNSAFLYGLKGDIYDSKDDRENAIAAYKKAIELDPDNSVRAHNNLGAQYLKQSVPLVEKYNEPNINFEESTKLEEQINSLYLEAIPHFIYVVENTKDVKIKYDALVTLRDLYKDTKNITKYKEVDAQIQELK